MKIVILVLSALISTSSFAISVDTPSPRRAPDLCEAKLFKPVRFRHRPHYSFEHREPAGLLIMPGERFPDIFATDSWIWQMYEDQSIMIAPKYEWKRFVLTGKGLNTHAVFVMHFKRKHRRTPRGKIIMGGEFRTAFGEMVMFNLKSGKFPVFDQETALPWAELAFTERGAPKFTEDTKRIIIDPTKPEDEGHTELDRLYDLNQLEMMADVRSHPHGDRVVSLYEELGRVLIKYTESGTAFGVEKLFGLREVRGRLYDAMPIFRYPFQSAVGADGLYFGIYRMWDSMTLGQNAPNTYVNYVGPELINNLMKFLFDRLSNEDRERLVEIREGFKNIPDWIKPDPHPMRHVMRPPIDANWTDDEKKEHVKKFYQQRHVKHEPYVPQWLSPGEDATSIPAFVPANRGVTVGTSIPGH